MSHNLRKKRLRKKGLLGRARWASYVAVGAAAVLATHESADAEIVYGELGWSVDGSVVEGKETAAVVGVDVNEDGKVDLEFRHVGSIHTNDKPFGWASVFPKYYAKIAGRAAAGELLYAYNLLSGTLVNAQSFQNGGFMAHYEENLNSEFLNEGIGYLGFAFNAGEGTQYGWMRVDMSGNPHNAFTLVDFAYAGVGEEIRVAEVPEPGSLGLLASGAVGLLLWRHKRRRSAPAS